MSNAGRPFVFVGVIVLVLIFYLTGPFASSNSKHDDEPTNAEGRLSRWLDVVAPPSKPFTLQHTFEPPALPGKAKPLISFSPFPLGAPAKPVTKRSDFDQIAFSPIVYSFQHNLENITLPTLGISKYAMHKPHNWRAGPIRPTYATLYSTVDGTRADPYFVAIQALIFQVLWSEETASQEYPMTVFVPPYIPQWQRDVFAGAGALVKEVPFQEWRPNVEGIHHRFQHQFSKVGMWNAMDFSHILYIDADNLLIHNVDEIFDLVKTQRCVAEKLSVADSKNEQALCDYVFAGVQHAGSRTWIDAGVFVLQPSEAMYEKLERYFSHTAKYDANGVDSAFLGWQFRQNGPFPAQKLPRKYNALYPQGNDVNSVSVVQAKLWSQDPADAPWLEGRWSGVLSEAVEFYESENFARWREGDGRMPDEAREDGVLSPKAAPKRPQAAAGTKP